MILLRKASDTLEPSSVLGVVLAYVLFHDCRDQRQIVGVKLLPYWGWGIGPPPEKVEGGAEGNRWAGSGIALRKRTGKGNTPSPPHSFSPHRPPTLSIPLRYQIPPVARGTEMGRYMAFVKMCQNTFGGPDVPSEQGREGGRPAPRGTVSSPQKVGSGGLCLLLCSREG